MSKNDYYVMAAKALVFLYKRLKKETEKGLEYLSPCTKQFPVDKDYFDYLLENLTKDGYISGVRLTKIWGGGVIVTVTEQINITPKGIDYLQENSKMRRILELLPEAAGIAAEFLPIP